MKHIANKTIMVVDDTQDHLNLAEIILSGEGFKNVITALSGSNAIKTAKNNDVDIILLDIEMPVMNGFEVCQTIKSHDDFRNVPIIFLSGRHEEQTLADCLRAGGIDFIKKPFAPEEMVAKVKAYLHLKHAYDQLRIKVETISTKIHDIAEMGKTASVISCQCRDIFSATAGYHQLLSQSIPENHQSRKQKANALNATIRATELVQKLSIFAETTKSLSELEQYLKEQ